MHSVLFAENVRLLQNQDKIFQSNMQMAAALYIVH